MGGGSLDPKANYKAKQTTKGDYTIVVEPGGLVTVVIKAKEVNENEKSSD